MTTSQLAPATITSALPATVASAQLSNPICIEIYGWLVVKQRLHLEQFGMKHSQGSTRVKVAQLLKLSPRAKYETFLTAVDAKVAQLKQHLQQPSV